MQTKQSLSCFEGDYEKIGKMFVDFTFTKQNWIEGGDKKTQQKLQNRLLILLFYQTILNQREAKPLKWPVPDTITQEMKER